MNEAQRRTIPFEAVLQRLEEFHDITMDQDRAINLGLNAWDKIGNKEVRFYKIKETINNYIVPLPCNIHSIEAVTLADSNDCCDQQDDVIKYIINDEKVPEELNDLYPDGTYIQYRHMGDHLEFEFTDREVSIIYTGIYADEEGLPFLNEKEAEAISYYLAYIYDYQQLRQGVQNAQATFQFTGQEWNRLSADARVPYEFTQNQMDQVLDIKHSWDRKMYGKSFKPIR